MKHLTKICLFYLLLLSINSTSGYTQTPKQIDSIFEISYTAYRNSDFETAVNNSFEINKLSKKINYTKGQVYALTLIAECLLLQGEYKKCLEYINKIEAFDEYLTEHPYNHWLIKHLTFESYQLLGLNANAQTEYRNAYSIIMKEKDKHKRNLSLLNMYIVADGIIGDNPDSVYQYLFKAVALMQDAEFKAHQKEHYNVNLAGLYIKLGVFFMDKRNNADSAIYYYKLANNNLVSKDAHIYSARLNEAFSGAYAAKGEIEKAIAYTISALETFKHLKTLNDIQRNYEKLAELYSKNGEQVKEREFIKLSKLMNDSLKASQAVGRDELIINLIKKKEKELLQTEQKHKFTILVIVLIIIVVLATIMHYFFKYIKKKKQSLLDKEKEIIAKDFVLQDKLEIISQNTKETEQLQQIIVAKNEESIALKQQINESFATIVELAKENDPHFWTRFQEIYPQFAPKLLLINPALKISELTFSAYIYLGFTTKEIAEYTFKALKTIESNRYNLRKRLFLKPETDLMIFLNNTIK